MIQIGGHVSSAGGPVKALKRAEEMGFASLQIHPSAPQSWAKPRYSPQEIADFVQAHQHSSVGPLFFHNIYLNNFASDVSPIWHASMDVSAHYLTLAAQMGARGVVTHLGSHKGIGMENALERVLDGLRRMLRQASPDSMFLIENTAGAGGTIGRSLEEIEMIFSPLRAEFSNIGVCIDTCHAFASGIPIHTEQGVQDFMQEFKTRLGLEALQCIHLNDSKFDFNTNKDRHENIGDGFIGYAGFSPLFHHPDVQHVPFIMEVPGLEDTGPDIGNRERAETIARG